MAAPSPAVAADDEEYEICIDDGFVYKRRRGLYPDVAPPSAHAAGPNPEAARRRCRRRALLRLRGKRLRELAHWEALEGKLQAQLPTPQPLPPQAPTASPRAAAAATSPTASVLDDLLARAEVEEAILKRVAGLCDELDALCRAHEEDVVDAITALPIWGDPKELMIWMQSPDAPGTSDLNFRKDYQNEGNGTFQSLDSRQGKRAIDAGGYDGYQEAAGVSPAAVQRIKESGKTMKRGPYQHKRCFQTGHIEKTCHETPTGLGDDPSILSENRKKKGVASPSDSKSVKKSKRFYQSTSPKPVSSRPRPTTRLAAAKVRNQEAS